jgi:hypothetical protein
MLWGREGEVLFLPFCLGDVIDGGGGFYYTEHIGIRGMMWPMRSSRREYKSKGVHKNDVE